MAQRQVFFGVRVANLLDQKHCVFEDDLRYFSRFRTGDQDLLRVVRIQYYPPPIVHLKVTTQPGPLTLPCLSRSRPVLSSVEPVTDRIVHPPFPRRGGGGGSLQGEVRNERKSL